MKRETEQRKAIEKIFIQQEKPLGIGEIMERGRELVNTLNQATVYRNLKRLVSSGWLKRINHPTLGTLWELADRGHHHHFYCNVCHNVYDLPGCALDQEKAVPAGFEIEEHEIFLSGTCKSCLH